MKSDLSIARLSGFGRGTAQHFTQNIVSLGTDPGCDVRFDAAWDKTVSPRHATLRRDGHNSWRLDDTSRDGCWIDGRRLSAHHFLEPGETILEVGRNGPRIKVAYTAERAAVVPAAPSAPVLPPTPPPAQAHAIYSPVAPSPVRARALEPLSPARRNQVPLLVATAVLIVFLVLSVAGGWYLLASRTAHLPAPTPSPEPAGNADERLAAVAQKSEDAIGLVVEAGYTRADGRTIDPFPEATAWAIGERVFATNSHVSVDVAEDLAKGQGVFIAINHHPDRRYRVTHAVVHPKYGYPSNFEGHRSVVPAYDVGLLYVDAPVSNRLHVAPEAELRKLASGYRVAYLGFPTEGLAGGGVDFRNPVAIMQSGILTSVTDFWLSRSDFADARLLEHNLASAGGASGSPVFNVRGEVVGIHSAGNHTTTYDQKSQRYVRAPSGVLINFAQRVDLLKDIYPDYGK